MRSLTCPNCGARLRLWNIIVRRDAGCPACKAALSPPAPRVDPHAITTDTAPTPTTPTTITTPDQVLPTYPTRTDGGERSLDIAKKSRLSLSINGIITLVVLGCAGLALVILVYPACYVVYVADRRVRTMNSMKQLAMACHAHHDQFKQFPTPKLAAQIHLSWRVTILPFIEARPLFDEFDRADGWDTAHNQTLLDKMPSVYVDRQQGNAKESETHFQYFTGAGTLWTDNGPVTLKDSFPGGTSNTFLFAEALDPVPWSKPAEMTILPDQPLPLSAELFLVAFADGSVGIVDRSRASDAAIRWCIKPGAEKGPPLDGLR